MALPRRSADAVGYSGPFHSGVDTLDTWLKRRALKNQGSGASRTFVVCEGPRVVAYDALASSAVAVRAAHGRFRRNMPNPIPVVVLGRLAVDQTQRGKGIGRALMRVAATVLFSSDRRGSLVSLLKDAWQGLQSVASLIDRVERQDREIEALRVDLRDARERLVAVETIIDLARGRPPKPPR